MRRDELAGGEAAASEPLVRPLDEHNRRLLERVHPPGWVNPDPADRYNLVVIGGGTAGLVTAAGAAGLGARVALVERHLLGGDCLNVGCVPSKAIIRAARARAAVDEAPRYGVEVPGEPRVDFAAVMARMRRLRASIGEHDSAQRFASLGVDVFLGDARFVGRDAVEVAGRRLRFRKACIATGRRAAELPIPGLAEAGYLTNETLFELTELPPRLVVIGGGPIGCEMAQAFRRFGSRVTLLEAAPRILVRDDPDAAERVRRSLEADGVEIVLSSAVKRVEKTPGGRTVVFEANGAERGVEADAILVSVGRKPNVEGLDLDRAGVAWDPRKGILVSDRLRTTNPNIFAAGDIASAFQFTHAADAMARIVIQNALFPFKAKASALTMPWCTYTDPELAHVGLLPEQAEERGIAVDTFEMPFREVDRAVLEGDEEGLAKVHVERGTDRIVGATVVARHAGEMIGEMALAMTAGCGLKTVARTIHPYPTQAEVWRKIGDAYNRTRLRPFMKRVLGRYLAWRR
ncbi:MAG: mercuric reductase [Acidobacteria bacterium]|nr:MAG: mercuric reductase [Acidobacteriota bacterium]